MQSLNAKHIKQDAIIAVLLTAVGISLISYIMPVTSNLKWVALASGCTAVMVAVYLQWFFNDLEKNRVLFAFEKWVESQAYPTALLDNNTDMLIVKQASIVGGREDLDISTYEWLHLQGVDFDSIEYLLVSLEYFSGNTNWKINDTQFVDIQVLCDQNNHRIGYTLQIVPMVVTIVQQRVVEKTDNLAEEKEKISKLQQEYIQQQEAQIHQLTAYNKEVYQEKTSLEADLAKLTQAMMTYALYMDEGKAPKFEDFSKDCHPLVQKTHHNLAKLFEGVENLSDERENYKNLLTRVDALPEHIDKNPLKFIYILSQSLYRNSQDLNQHNDANAKIFNNLRQHFNTESQNWQSTQQAFNESFNEAQTICWGNLKFLETITMALQTLHAQQSLLQYIQSHDSIQNNQFLGNSIDKINDLSVRSKQFCHHLLANAEQLKKHLNKLNQNMKAQSQAMIAQQTSHTKHSTMVDLLRIQTEQIATRLENIQSIETKINQKCEQFGITLPDAKQLYTRQQFDDVLLTGKNNDQDVLKSA